jgi:hypothetical protein
MAIATGETISSTRSLLLAADAVGNRSFASKQSKPWREAVMDEVLVGEALVDAARDGAVEGVAL